MDLLRNADVRKQHELFDEAVCLSQLFLLHIDRFRGLRAVKVDLDFGRREIESTGSHASSSELPRKRIEKAYALGKVVLLVPKI